MPGDSETADSVEPTQSLWIWTEQRPGESPVYFHDYCSLDPFDVADEVPFMFDFAGEDGTVVQRATGRVLTYALRHAPLLCIWALIGLVFQSAVTDLVGVEYLPVDSSTALVLVFGAVLWGAIASLLAEIFYEAVAGLDSRLESTLTLLRAGLIYGVLGLLVGGAAWAALQVYTTPGAETAPSIAYAFGFLALLYVGGPIVYDGMRRSETLFTALDRTDLLLERDKDRYAEEFLPRLQAAFRTDVWGVPAVLPLGVLFVSQFAWIWHLGAGPFGLDTWSTLLFAAGVDVVIVVLTVQFVLLVRFLNELLRADNGSGIHLQYLPGHEDDSGGYRDFGRFVTRVNSLLVLAGIYLAYRLHVQGSRDPLGPAGGTTVTAWDSLLWTYSYVIPVVVYALVIAVWIYFSFWQLHRKMVRDKRRAIHEERPGDGRTREDLTTLQTYREAPEWPINDRLLVTVLSIDAISVGLSMLTLF